MDNKEFAKVFENGVKAAQKASISAEEMAKAWREILSSVKGLREMLEARQG